MKIFIKAKTKTYEVLFDREDAGKIKNKKWHILMSGNGARPYARTNIFMCDQKFHGVLLHRLIMGVENDKSIFVDHINHNTLDNRRRNLRKCTKQENCRNRTTWSKTGYLGVSPISSIKNGKTYKYAVAHIRINGKQTYLGCFRSTKEAALAYDKAAIENYGTEFQTLNFPIK